MFFCTCPADPEDIADDYCLDRLDTETAQAFEDHYLTCPECARVTAEALSFVEAFREVETTRSGKKRPALTFR
jgi:anti-sigma factor RsiW